MFGGGLLSWIKVVVLECFQAQIKYEEKKWFNKVNIRGLETSSF